MKLYPTTYSGACLFGVLMGLIYIAAIIAIIG